MYVQFSLGLVSLGQGGPG